MAVPQQTEEAIAKARQYVACGHLPAVVVAVANRETILTQRAFGQDAQEAPELLDRVFALASITKAITAVGVARLHEEGVVDYDTPIADIVPRFGTDEGRRRITLRHIFTHTTGLSTEFAPGDDEIDYSSEVLLRLLCEGDLLFEPGTRMSYSTYSYQLINAVVAHLLDGMGMGEFLSRYVFEPAGMPDTSFRPDPTKALCAVDHPIPDCGMLPKYCALEMSGSGLWSTVSDLVSLGRSLLAPGKLLSRETFAKVTQSQPGLPMLGDEEHLSNRTLGWVKEPQAQFPGQPASGFYHGGATGTLLWIDPAADIIFVLLTNRWASGNDHAFDVLNCLYG